MKIAGKKIEHGPNSEIIVFGRENGQDLAFRCTAMLDKTEFDKYCPLPKPPKKIVPKLGKVDDLESPKFAQALERYNKNFMDYLLISSITAVAEKDGDPDLPIEWEKVVRANKDTWHLWEEEFKEAGLGDMERKRLFNAVMSVNSLNEARVEEARKSFLQRQQEEPLESSSQMDEQIDMPSGEHVNGQELNSPDAQPVGMTSTNE